MATDVDATERSELRTKRMVTALLLVAMAVAYALLFDTGPIAHLDHERFLQTIRYEHAGNSYYDAYVRTWADHNVAFSELRAIRQPLIFLVWRVLPIGWLWPTFTLVMAGACVALVTMTRTPPVVLPVLAYLLMSGRIPSDEVVEQWLLVELWAFAALAVSIAAHVHGRPRLAALFGALGALIRELAFGYVLLQLALAWHRKDQRGLVAWASATVVGVAGYGLHLLLASSHLVDEGNEATIIGTGDPPRTVWEMVAWMIPGPDAIGVAIVAVGLVRLAARRDELLPLLGLFAIAGGGLFVARAYWGFLFIPFGIFLCGEELVRLVSWVRERRAQPRGPSAEPAPVG